MLPTTVYNLNVADFHTYFVGKTGGGLWVHNADDCPLTVVGRWMHPKELETMQKTGMVQESLSGTTHVAHPAAMDAFQKQAAKRSVYVEFQVPTNSVVTTGEAWGKIIGPNSTQGRLAARKGLPIPQMPAALNISPIASKVR